MPLQYRADNHYQIIPAPVLYAAASAPAGYIRDCDFVLRMLYDAVLVCDPVSCDRLFGYNTGDDAWTERDLGVLRESEYNPNTDWLRYGSIANVLLSRVMRGGNNHFSNVGEHEVYHAQTNGTIVPSGAGFLASAGSTARVGYPSGWSSSFSLPATGYRLPSYTPWLHSHRVGPLTRSYYVRGQASNWEIPYESFPGRNHAVYNGKLCGLWSQGESFSCAGQKGSWVYTSTHSNIRWSFDGSTLVVQYRLTVSSNQGGVGRFSLDVKFTSTLTLQIADGSRPLPGGDEDRLANEVFRTVNTVQFTALEVSPTFSYQMVNGQSYSGGSKFTWSGTGQGRFGSQPFGRSYSSSSLGGRYVTIFCDERKNLEENFRFWIESNLRDIRAASALSTADAMTDLQASPNTDVLQNLVKIKDISSQIPKIQEALSILRKLANRDFSCIREIVDFLTGLRLQYGFQWRPEFDLLLEYLPALPGALLAFSSDKLLIGRGKYEYNFQPEECYRTCKLVVRTKIVASNNLSGPLATYLKLDSIGILPTPANVWDLVPFSFVVNWFTNMGKRIRQLGQMANFWLLDPVVIVHSYTFTSSFTSDEMNAMHFKVLRGSSNPEMKVFIREVSSLVSLPVTSRFDFQRVTTAPDWSIVASLLWQWMT